jgi:hypothetical protein
MEMDRLDQRGPGIRSNPLHRVWRWIKGQVVQDVTQDEALCEFDCRKLRCTRDEWETCDRRIRRGAG